MNIQQLEYIIALDERKSFSKAAEMCFITQATLSTMVKKLEIELDLILFDRKTNPIITTDCGIEIIELAKQTLRSVNQIKELAKSIKGKIEGRITIGIIPTIANSLLPLFIKSMLEKYPNLYLEVKEITTNDILKKLKEGSLDVGILSTPVKHAEEFEEQILYYESLLVYGETANNKKYVLPQHLVNEKIWLLEEGHCLRDQFINLCSLNRKKLNANFKFESNSFETLLNMVDSFGGLTVIPELYVNTLSVERKKKIIQFTSPYPVREVSLIYHRPYAKHRLISILESEIKALIVPLLTTNTIQNNEQIIVKT
ncbi:MAG: LysR family transcriptional regulator [Bacteroidetes bacterium]|nr:LysR family transcriptional regulator [Bacteroidota bacterium]